MAISEVPVRANIAHQEMLVPLEGRVYLLELRWSGREEKWYLDIRDEDGVKIYTGIAIVLNFPLGVRCASEKMWQGALFAVDTSGANAEPALADFGERVKLIYFDSSSLPIDEDAS